MSRNVDITTPSAREIRVSRTFDGSLSLLFDCHTKPALVKKWLLGPPGWAMPVCEIDLRVGGAYHYVWRSDEKDMEFGVQGAFHRIDAPHRTAYDQTMDGVPGQVLCTTTFSAASDGTRVILTLQYESEELRNNALESGMTEGMSMSYERLDEVVMEPVRSS